MRLATIRIDGRTRAVRVDDDALVDLGAADVGEVLTRPDWARSAREASGTTYDAASPDYAPLVTTPGKIVCVGLNYRTHIQEMGRELPDHPTLFCKFADSLVGAHDDILRPDETDKFDWEGELAFVIGRRVRRAVGVEAEAAIAGFAVLNDVTCRDWQFRTREWLQGKVWDSSTPLGPWLVTPDELDGEVRPRLALRTELDGEVVQEDDTRDLLFDPVALVEYISTIVRLNPGDVIATGTPGGVGNARDPQVFLTAGQVVEVAIEGIGSVKNTIVDEGK